MAKSRNELPIDVKRLAEVLYELYIANNNSAELKEEKRKFINDLKANIDALSLDDFLKQLGKLFRTNGGSQFQVLLPDFLLHELNPREYDSLKVQIINATRLVLPPRRKQPLLSALK